MERKFDFHLHSYFSDGILTPADLVRECKKLDLEIISLTDHETMKGVPEATKTAKEVGIKVIPGLEVSCNFGGKEHHILGYFVDQHNQPLDDFLNEWKETKVEQIKKIVENLQSFGFQINLNEVFNQTRGIPRRPHVVDVIFFSSHNLQLLTKMKIEDEKEFFRIFLSRRGKAFVERDKPKIEEVIDIIKTAGGMSIWAHAFWEDARIKEIERRAAIFKEMGLDGLEVLYSYYTKEQTLAIHKLAKRLSMKESGGSDFHGAKRKSPSIGELKNYGIKINFPFERVV